ncbi:TOM (translocase of outer membrane) complex component [Cystobasidiomycetes sp. EMM_F5]
MSGGFSHPAGIAASTTNGQLADGVSQSVASASSSTTLGSRVSEFIERNKRAVLLATGATVVFAGAAGYYYYTRPHRHSRSAKDWEGDFDDVAGGDDIESSPTGQRKKSKKKKQKRRGSISNATQPEPSATSSAVESPDPDVIAQEQADPLMMTSAQVAALPLEERRQLAAELKVKGNKLYSSKKFREAVEVYSKAIECDEQAVYYSNRAACYTNLNDNTEVVNDCTSALRLDPVYVKAINRRGQAREALGGEDNLFLALCDFTAGAIIDGFKSDSMAKAVDRVMKRLASEKAVRIMKGEDTLFLAYDALDARNYTHAFTLFNEAIEQGIKDDTLSGRAYNMTGTFKFILGDAKAALEDLELSTKKDPNFTQTWVKKASVHMELASHEEAFESFETAIKINPADPDIYYHRGQVYFITGQFGSAIEDYKRSSDLDKTFVFSQIQHAVARYKNDQAEQALHMFKRIIKDFGSTSPEVYNYYGELLLDRGEFTSALENLDKAIKLEKARQSPGVTTNVLPMVNKALCLYQSRTALEEAEAICREALALDPASDIAVATLGQLLLQQNKIEDAVKTFEHSAEIARTEPELQNALAYENATRAQLDFIEKYPTVSANLIMTLEDGSS